MSSFLKYFSYGAVFAHIFTSIVAYHFDVDNVILFKDVNTGDKSRGSYFGYSVALSNTTSEKSSIFVGAPRANSTSYKNINEPGTVFKCEIDNKAKPCKEWVIPETPGRIPQSGSWLGGSISIGNGIETDNVLVCAPRWQDIRNNEWGMSGMCYQATASNCSGSECSEKGPFQPLEKAPPLFNGALYFTMGQSGFSTHIIPTDPPDLQYMLGCPGVYLGHGTPMLSIKDKWDDSFVIPNAREGRESVQNSAYSGYAVTSGMYFGELERVYATGAPRAQELRGKVVLFEFPESIEENEAGEGEMIKIHTAVAGDQIGEYFGSALASCDIDGDGFDDLLVGAPQWSINSDEGRIYIFRGNTGKNFKDRHVTINGETLRGRFGSAITCLGDIDYDGYGDIAVGAPYEGNGTVYIYHGSKDGLIQTQKIYAPKDVRGFGISISEPKDVDNNGYGDIAVGAYLSDHVALFRSERVVNMAVTLSSNLPGERLGRDADFFVVSVCSSYTGKNAPQELSVIKKLEITDIYQRAEIVIEKGKHLRTYEFNDTLMKSDVSCQNFTITLMGSDRYFLKPINLLVTQRLNTAKENVTGSEVFRSSSAVTNRTHQEVQSSLDIPFALDCGNTTICNSNLSIHMTTDLQNVSHFVIGSASHFKLNIAVTNTGDQAYRTRVNVSIPMYIRLLSKPPTCTTGKMGNIIICDLANPLDRNKTKNVTLDLDVSHVTTQIEQFYLTASAKTESNDAASGNHEASLLINCVTETDIGIAGQADANRYMYMLKGEEEQLRSITFQQIYEIKNYEVTPITKALFSVSIPTHWTHNGNEIEVVKVNNITGKLDKREFKCVDKEQYTDMATLSDDLFNMTNQWNGDNSSLRSEALTKKKFPIDDGKIFDVSLDNRTLYINCTNPSFKWKTITCPLESFESADSVAKLVIALDLLLPNFTPEIMNKKNIIFFVTNASVSTTETVNNRPDSFLIGTMFVGSVPAADPLPRWLIPLSVFIGLLLLILIILGLFKFGFFKRTKKMKLEAYLKDEDTLTSPVFLTTSSREALDTT